MSRPPLSPALRALSLLLVCVGPACCEVHLTVSPAGQGGQYTSVQAALAAVPAGGAERHVIDISPGVYTERVFVLPDKVTLRGLGASPEDTKITYFETSSTPPNESTVHASTVIRGKDFVAENLTFENSAGQTAGPALAIYVRGDRALFNRCRFLGWQDTLRSESGRHYFYDSYIEGSVDFIYGKGQAYFENSTLFAKRSGYLTAQGRESDAESNGYVFKNSTILGSAPSGSVYLGRPWQAYSRAVFIDTKMSSVINPTGWQTWSGNNHLTSFFAEFNSMDLNGDAIDVSQRVPWSYQLTPQQADAFSKQNWLGGSDGWNPVIAVPPTLSGDYNGDGLVDAADYSVWRDSLGQTGAGLPADADQNGVVGFEDYLRWRGNYGRGVPIVATPPGDFNRDGLVDAADYTV
ncbi:MAG: hypothetical protein KDA37_01325, partial [Planctomycetales bacterium]|nr:hypothetical protein [Planctomycetales bacterium]